MKTLAKGVIRSFGYDVRKARPTPPPVVEADPAPARLLPRASSSQLISGHERVAVLEPDSVDGNVSLLELLVINTLTARAGARTIFEIGTFDGRTSLNMIANAPEDAVLHTLDLPRSGLDRTTFALHANDRQYVDKAASGMRFSGTPWAPRIHQLFGDSATFDYSPYERRIDLMFIDGSHHYDYVKNDTEVALRLAAPGAVLIWHDYQPCWPGVIKYLNERHAAGGVFAGLRHVEGTSVVYLPLPR